MPNVLRRGLVFVVFASALLGSTATPSGAQVLTGGFAFNGTLSFSAGLPCTQCGGSFGGQAHGEAADDDPIGVGGCLNCTMTATFAYTELNEPCLAGKVTEAFFGVASGLYSIDSDRVHDSGTISWARVGIALVIELDSSQGTFNGEGVGELAWRAGCTATSGTLAGAIAFVP